MAEKFCVECLEANNCTHFQQEKSYQVKDEEITINADFLRCNSCGNLVPDLELDESNYQQVYAEFRKRKSLLQPQEIKEIREIYGISQRNLAKLFCWSHATLSRYESGAIQDNDHNNQLLMLRNPENMLSLLERGKDRILIRDYNKIKSRTLSIINESREERLFNTIENYFATNEASIFTGFRKFNYDKIINAIKYFATMDSECLKVKLMKYLWYSDFLHFKKYTVSIFGLRYIHLPLGPVPEKYEILLGLTQENDIEIEPFPIGDYCGERIKALTGVDYNAFTPEETSTMNTVLEKFKLFTSSGISDYSHKEIAYINTSSREPIPYSYAMELSID